MLVKVKDAKLVLGITKYVAGDIFDCRDPEALVLIAGGVLVKAAADAVATREPPQPGKTGITNKGVPFAPKDDRAAAVQEPYLSRRARKRLAVQSRHTDSPE